MKQIFTQQEKKTKQKVRERLKVKENLWVDVEEVGVRKQQWDLFHSVISEKKTRSIE